MLRYSKIAMRLLTLCVCVAVCSSAFAAEYRIRYLNPLPGDVSTWFKGMSSSGMVVGISTAADGSGTYVMWNPDGSVERIPGLTPYGMSGEAINNLGQMAGQDNGTGHAVLRNPDGSIRDLGSGGVHCMNDAGQVGGMVDTDALYGEYTARAAIWEPDGSTTIIDHRAGNLNSYVVAMNQNGDAVGWWFSRDDSISHGFAWSKVGGWVDLGLCGGSDFLPGSISDSGVIAGHSWAGNLPTLRYQDGTFLRMDDSLSYAGCWITGDGRVIINSDDSSYIWSPDGSKEEFPRPDGWPECSVGAIMDNGLMGGMVRDIHAGTSFAVVWEPVPEPSSILGLVCGLSLAGGTLIKRRMSF